MDRMSDFDWSDLDARLLRLLVAVVETGSVTGAAHRLGVTQSAVSHLVGKLKRIVGDALFVKSGRGIVATARAAGLWRSARATFCVSRAFSPMPRLLSRRAGGRPSPSPPTTFSGTRSCRGSLPACASARRA